MRFELVVTAYEVWEHTRSSLRYGQLEAEHGDRARGLEGAARTSGRAAPSRGRLPGGAAEPGGCLRPDG